jgi:hypothetical protein
MHLKYRVRGLPQLPSAPEPFGHAVKQSNTPDQALDRLVQALPHARLCDHLYDFKSRGDLNRSWPTFGFLAPDRKFPILKTAPLRLAEYFDFASARMDERANTICNEYEQQQAEKTALVNVLQACRENSEPSLDETPLALAVACHLFAGSHWLQSHRQKVEMIATGSPIASFVALASGCFLRDPQILLASIGRDPFLALEVARSSGFAFFVERDWIERHLKVFPLYHAAWLHLNRETKAAMDLLQFAANRDALCAATCLAFEPFHRRASEWRKVAWETEGVIYWAGKIWRSANEDIQQFVHAGSASTLLAETPKWYYHWLRDVDEADTRDKLALLWPDPWAVELIADKNLPSDWVIDLCASRELDPNDPLESAVILWAADYTSRNNEN